MGIVHFVQEGKHSCPARACITRNVRSLGLLLTHLFRSGRILRVQVTLLPRLHLLNQAVSRMLRFAFWSLFFESSKFNSNSFTFQREEFPGGVLARNKYASAETVRYAFVTLRVAILLTRVKKLRQIAYFVALSAHVDEAYSSLLFTIDIISALFDCVGQHDSLHLVSC